MNSMEIKVNIRLQDINEIMLEDMESPTSQKYEIGPNFVIGNKSLTKLSYSNSLQRDLSNNIIKIFKIQVNKGILKSIDDFFQKWQSDK